MAGNADITSDQGPSDDCLKSVTRGNECCRNEGTFDREVDQRGTNPNSRPDAATQQECCGERDTRWRPYRGSVSRRDREPERDPGRDKIESGDQTHPPEMAYWTDGYRGIHTILAQTCTLLGPLCHGALRPLIEHGPTLFLLFLAVRGSLED